MMEPPDDCLCAKLDIEEDMEEDAAILGDDNSDLAGDGWDEDDEDDA